MSADDQRAAEFPMCWYSPSLGFLVPDPMSDDGQGVIQVANGRVMLCLPDDAARLGAVDRLRAELAETRAASDSAVVAINPDTGIVHRRMSDGSWYALDVIPGRDAVVDKNLVPYLPQENATRCPRTWSLPDPPPDDVTVVHVQAASGEVFRCVREGHRWRDGSGRDLFRLHRRRLFGFGELLDMGKVVEGEAPAVEPPVLADEAGGSR